MTHTINGEPINKVFGAIGAERMSGPAASAEKTTATHKPECGDVGEAGEHGELGDNAAGTEK